MKKSISEKISKEIVYVTGNPGKFEEVKNFTQKNVPYINLTQFDVTIPEIQTLDQKAIAIDKAIKAWNILQKPLLIDDSAIYFEKYNKFPGTLSKFVTLGLGFDGILKLIENGDRAHFLLHLIYIENINSIHIFEGRCEGKLIKPEKFSGHKTLPYDCIFIPDGTDKTYAEMRNTDEGNKYFYRIRALKKFLAFLIKN